MGNCPGGNLISSGELSSRGPRVVLILSVQWIRPSTLNCEVPGSNLLAAIDRPVDKALNPHCLVPWRGLKFIVEL